MQQIKNLFQKPVAAARRKKIRVFSPFLAIYGASLIVLLVLATGCDTRNEKADTSGTDNPETVSRSDETQKTINNKQQKTAEEDNSISEEAQKSSIQEQAGIKVTFVELGSVNCIPCKMMQSIMDEIEKEYGDEVKVVFHDVWTDEGRPYAEKYKIRVIPTQVFLDKDGKEYFRHEGFFPKDELVSVLKLQGIN
ncbi:thioredoxin family protein [Candidatus Latescibacterota bacterium]